MSRRKLTEQEKTEQSVAILKALECGSIKQAFTSLGLSRHAFYYKVKALNLHDDMKAILSKAQDTKTNDIKNLVDQGLSYKQIANKLNIKYNVVLRLVRDRKIHRRRTKNCRNEIEQLRAKMMTELSKNYSYAEIADAFKCSRQNVHQIVNKEIVCVQ